MKKLKIMICALFVVCAGLFFAGCKEEKKNFNINNIIINEFHTYTYDGKPHAVTVSYEGVDVDVTYALVTDSKSFKPLKKFKTRGGFKSTQFLLR